MFSFPSLIAWLFIAGLLLEPSGKRYDNIKGVFWVLIIVALFSAIG